MTSAPTIRAVRRLAAVACLFLGLAGCGQRAPSPLAAQPQTDAADFVRTGGSAVAGDLQRLYIGLAGNGVFLGARGDAAPPAETLPGSSMPIMFGDLWDRTERRALLSLSLSPEPLADDSYWQVLDIDTGLATTHWRCKTSAFGRGERRVDALVAPEGTCCWRVRTTGTQSELGVHAGTSDRDAWRITDYGATVTLRTNEFVAPTWVRLLPAPEWRLDPRDGGTALDAEPRAALAADAFVAISPTIQGARGAVGSMLQTDVAYDAFDGAARATAASWRDFWSRSRVDVPDPELMKWYRRSLYYLGAMSANSTYPPGPMGPSPIRWGGRIFGHDTTYMHYALLTSGHADIAQSYVDWYLKVLPEARRRARDAYHLPGARYGWEQNWRGEEVCTAPFADEHHVNADIAWQAYMQARWTGDDALLQRIKPLIRDTGTFMAALMEWDESLGAFVSRPAADLDENASRASGPISTQAGAAWLAEACHELGVGTPETERIRGRVYLPEIATDDGPVLGAFVGDTLDRPMKHPSPLIAYWWLPVLDPKAPLARRTFDAMLQSVDLNHTPTFNRPWMAAVAARMHDGERAHRLLSDLLTAPGAIVDDTCFAETQGARWTHFLTTCGALVSAVNEMLLQSDHEGEIDVLPAVPAGWTSSRMSFDGLLAQGGIRVSARWSASRGEMTLKGGPRRRVVRASMPVPPAAAGDCRVMVDGRSTPCRKSPGLRITFPVTLPPGATRAIAVTGG